MYSPWYRGQTRGDGQGRLNSCLASQGPQLRLVASSLPETWQDFISAQLLSHVLVFVSPWTAAHQSSPSITSSWILRKLMTIELVMPSNKLTLCHPLLFPSIFPSIRVFSMSQFFASGGQRIRVSASASILPVNIRDWFPLELTGWISLLSKGLSRVLQHHSSKASILWHSAFFIVQLSHPYMTSGKNIALIRWTFVGKVTSLLFNMLFRLVITFLPRSKCLLISWLQSSSAVIFGAPQKVCHCFHCFPIYLPWSDGAGCHDLSFLNVKF